MKNIIIGQYVPGTSFLYKIDPRSKIIALVLLMVSTFILKDVLHIFIMLSLVVVLLKLGGIPIGRIAKGLRPIMVLIIFTFTFQVLFVKTGTLLYDRVLTVTLYNAMIIVALILVYFFTKNYVKSKLFYFAFFAAAIISTMIYITPGQFLFDTDLKVYTDGISGAFFIMIRLVIIVTLSTILTLTTKPTDLTHGIECLMRPLKKIGFNSEDFALIISLSLRYIPTIFDEAQKIMAAQASRGADFSEGKLKDKLKQIISLLVPMFIIAFMRSEELADAMESRNFVPGQARTRINVLKFSMIDVYSGIFTLLCFAGAIVIKVI